MASDAAKAPPPATETPSDFRAQQPPKSSPPLRRNQAVFVLRLTPKPGVDAVKALRAVLKLLLRRFGLRALSVHPEAGK
jgi:hypothetical protein